MATQITRRTFLAGSAATGVAVNVSTLTSPAEARLLQKPPRPGPDWLDASGQPRYRLDAIAKVTGEKTFSRDYRAQNLEGWPTR
ncbi:twin-arginine translocation signal domain-containing protein [Chelativorans xinjiangense]|uniref:twin-arginine translocation signal domain-containing protein n=1 Tax=Chelativorans xinjiangense TaxID=2681485 RepID=UPI0013597990|nr:twin-arginine translocation signal domain-containing protein [Chelativorans xinjiangense]